MAVLIEKPLVVSTQAGHDRFANCSVEESSVRATSQPIQVLRAAFGRSCLAALLTVLYLGLGPGSVSADVLSPQTLTVAKLQIESLILAQGGRPAKKPTKGAAKKIEERIEDPALSRDKEALPADYRVPPVAVPEISITKELPIPDKTDKAAWKIHTRKMSDYSRVLVKGNFGDEKLEREILRYGITFRLNKLTHRNILFPSDEERAKVVDPEKTKPEAPESLVSVREELISDLRKTNSGAGAFQIRDAFLDIFVEEAPKLLDNSTYVRFQIGYLLSVFNNRDEDRDRNLPEEPCLKATKVLISLVNDDKIHFWSKVYPVRGLARICRYKNCKPEDRFVIIETLIKQLQGAKTLHWWYGASVAESLCQLGDPHDRAKTPAVAEALFTVLKDPAYADRVRVQAAHSLARIPLETFKRTEEIATEILRLGYDLAQAFEKDPKNTQWREDFLLLYLSFRPENATEKTELKGLLTQVENKGTLAGSRSVVNEAYQY
ncbi:MAG: hypothetical protein JWM11_2623, partial [Planctomycetaceae bacterium]|nr:hypothetical protein [Planctomycetaceae bacterium]